MTRPGLLRRAVLFVGAISALAAKTGRAQPDAGVCEAERRELAQIRRSLDACNGERRLGEQRFADCDGEREQALRRNDETAATLSTCQETRDRTCSAAGSLAEAVAAAGKAGNIPSVPGCVSSAQQAAVAQMIEGHATAASSLADLIKYASGTTEVPPQPRAPNPTALRALVDQLVGTGKSPPPLLTRRLLIESIQRIAPRFWRRVTAGGSKSIDVWLSSGAPLDEALIAEAHSGALSELSAARPGETPRLVTALRLVHSYREIAGCDRRGHPPRECTRARRIQSLLETTGPLVVRQRVQEIWATPCAQVGRPALALWVRAFPTARAAFDKSHWREIEIAAAAKMFSCYLGDEAALGPDADQAMQSFAGWMRERLPGAGDSSDPSLDHVEAIRDAWSPAGPEDFCTRAVDALARLDRSSNCEMSPGAQRTLLQWFTKYATADQDGASFQLQACARVAKALWRGKRPKVATSVNRAPAVDDLVTDLPNVTAGAASLRAACGQRVGDLDSFPARLAPIARIAAAAGDDVSKFPWRTDPKTNEPVEAERLAASVTLQGWLGGLFGRTTPCGSLLLDDERCRVCAGPQSAAVYDCQLLERLHVRWRTRTERLVVAVTGVVGLAAAMAWLVALLRATRKFHAWRWQVRASLQSIGMTIHRDWLLWLFPSRLQALTVTLPSEPEWRRWGARARVVRVANPAQVTERDVVRAASLGRAINSEIALLLHDEGASPDLNAVRALLEWAAKGPGRAMQILPLATERLKWTRSADDLLDVVEETSLRGNPFDVRGRLVSSSQFFNRERLLSGLLAAAQAGHWVMITSLRRFGKSSLALEVARRLTGPSAYVDLAGFHYEVAMSSDPAVAASTILRYVLLRLHQSARQRYPAAVELPDPPTSDRPVDASELTTWLRSFVVACRRAADDRTPSFLLIFDEVEQAIGVGPTRIAHAIDVLSVLVGQLRASLMESLAPSGCRFGVVFCSAVHPLLWAPLATLGQQSFMGAFQSVFVPRLPEEAAVAMMRGLGSRQGIRFTDAALDLIIRETAAIPILARRVGSSVLELYDPERARQGGLGAVEVGVEGAAAAVQREEEPGAPLRVWVESEIGDPQNPAGAILRRVAAAGRVSTRELREVATAVTREHLVASGVAALIGPDELGRRAQEAAGLVLRMLAEIGMLTPEGDPLAPEAMSFPDSIVRRILASEVAPTGFGF